MNIKCKNCGTIFEFPHKKPEANKIKLKCSVCGHIWNWQNKKPTRKPWLSKKPKLNIKHKLKNKDYQIKKKDLVSKDMKLTKNLEKKFTKLKKIF